MSKVKILDAEFELNMYNLADAKRVEQAIDAFESKRLAIAATLDKLPLSEFIEQTCIAAFECFNAIFGTGADKKIFGGECDLLKCGDAIVQLRNAVGESQTKAFNSRFAAYLPNRQKS